MAGTEEDVARVSGVDFAFSFLLKETIIANGVKKECYRDIAFTEPLDVSCRKLSLRAKRGNLWKVSNFPDSCYHPIRLPR